MLQSYTSCIYVLFCYYSFTYLFLFYWPPGHRIRTSDSQVSVSRGSRWGMFPCFGKVIWRMLNVCWLQKMIRTKSTDNIYPGFWVEFHRNLLIALHMVGFIGGIRFKTVWPDLNSTKLGEISSDSPSRFFFWKSNSKVTMVSMCLFGVTNFAGTLQGEIHISHQTGKGKSSTLGQTAGTLESPKILSLLLVSPSILHFLQFFTFQSSEWSPSHTTTCSSTRWFPNSLFVLKQLL